METKYDAKKYPSALLSVREVIPVDPAVLEAKEAHRKYRKDNMMLKLEITCLKQWHARVAQEDTIQFKEIEGLDVETFAALRLKWLEDNLSKSLARREDPMFWSMYYEGEVCQVMLEVGASRIVVSESTLEREVALDDRYEFVEETNVGDDHVVKCRHPSFTQFKKKIDASIEDYLYDI